ncbi:MAG: hypothetical protein QOF30_2570, partial [Acidimicrobiaceae bacterium]|nr:hypothetical protein [Acidimicrobiaceae bacterium]
PRRRRWRRPRSQTRPPRPPNRWTRAVAAVNGRRPIRGTARPNPTSPLWSPRPPGAGPPPVHHEPRPPTRPRTTRRMQTVPRSRPSEPAVPAAGLRLRLRSRLPLRSRLRRSPRPTPNPRRATSRPRAQPRARNPPNPPNRSPGLLAGAAGRRPRRRCLELRRIPTPPVRPRPSAPRPNSLALAGADGEYQATDPALI